MNAAVRPVLLLPVAGGILALAAAMGIGRFAYTPILPAMQRATHFDTTQAGLLASANYAGYLAGALLVPLIPGAMQGRALRVAVIVTAVTTALMAITTNFIAWGVIRFLSGLASAGVFVLASSLLLSVLRQEGRSSLSGWLYSGAGLGIAASGLAVRVAGGKLGWRGDWLLLSLMAAATIYPCGRWLPYAVVARTPHANVQHVPAAVPRAALALLATAYLLEGVGYIVTGTFLVAIVNRMPGLAARGPDVWIVVGVAAAPSSVLWGLAAGRIGYARALALAYAALACGILLPIYGGLAAALAAAVLFGGTFLGITALTLTLAGQLVPHGSTGIIGILTAAFGIGQVVGPVLAGLIAGRAEHFTPALVGAAVVVAVGGALMLVLQPFDPSRRTLARARQIV